MTSYLLNPAKYLVSFEKFPVINISEFDARLTVEEWTRNRQVVIMKSYEEIDVFAGDTESQ